MKEFDKNKLLENTLDIYIKPTDELHDSGFKYLEIENKITGKKILYDVFITLGAIDLHLDVSEEGVIHLWSNSIDNKDKYGYLFGNELSEYGQFNVLGEGAVIRRKINKEIEDNQ